MFIEESLKDKLSKVEEIFSTTLDGFLGVNLTHVAKDRVSATLAVEQHHKQPFGLMHGGVSLVLAESLASIGGWANAEEGKKVVGLELNANHLRPVVSGEITATGTPIHIGQKTQVWKVEVVNTEKKLICTSRCTLAVIDG